MPVSDYQKTILNMRSIPIKKTREIEERLETSLLMADSQLRTLIGNEDKPLAIRAYQQKRMRIVQMVNELSIVSNQVVSEAIMDVSNQVANTQQEATNDLLIENDDANLMLDLSDVPRLTLEGLAQRYHIETLKISSNVWAQKQINEIETVITAGIARGQSARSMSNQLSQFVLGGGVGMGQSLKTKTMRLARTEINNSYWEASRASSEQSPVVKGIKWELSGRHPQYDVCDLLVSQNLFGLGRGVYPPEYLPPKPHPNCLCYQIDVLRDVDEFDQERAVPTLQKDIDKVRIGKGGQGFSKGYKKRQLDLFRNVVRATIEQRGVVMPLMPSVPEEPAASTFGDAVRREIAKGVNTEQDYIRIGKMLREEMAEEYEAIRDSKRGDTATQEETRSLLFFNHELSQLKKDSYAVIWEGAATRDLRLDEKTAYKSEEIYQKLKVLLENEKRGSISPNWQGRIPLSVASDLDFQLGLLKIRDGAKLALGDLRIFEDIVNKARTETRLSASQARDSDPELAAIVKNVISQIRPVGAEGRKHNYASRSNRKIKDWLDETMELVPTDWVNSSIGDPLPLLTKKVKRGFYRHRGTRRDKGQLERVSILASDTWNEARSRSTVLHEFGHRMEDTLTGVPKPDEGVKRPRGPIDRTVPPPARPDLFDIERQFYDRRTAGERAVQIKGCGPSEKGRKDEFTEEYMGKEYVWGGEVYAYEILSMGLEGVYYGNYDLYEKDPEYFDLILGLLAAK